MSTGRPRDAYLQEFMQMYELRAACDGCTHKHSRISYSITATPHQCSRDLLLVKAKIRGHKWSPVLPRPTHPRPRRYEVCWYFQEDIGCSKHHEKCTYASCPEEAAVWNMQKNTNLDNKTIIHLITQKNQLAEHGETSSQGHSSYQERLLEEYRRSNNEILIISEHVDDVIVKHDENLCVDCLHEDSEIRWKFTVSTERSLGHVALLKLENGGVFSLSESLKNTFPPITYIAGHQLHSSHSTYELSVSFLSFRPGVYEQWLVFDFSIRPVLLRRLKVRVGQEFHGQHDEMEASETAEMVSDERWNRGNRVIVPFMARKENEQLLSKYKPPKLDLQFNPHAEHSSPLDRENYRERAHHFLYMEERAEDNLINRLNICGKVSLSIRMSHGEFDFFAKQGMLFATLKVSCSLTQDSPEGQVLKRGVDMALVNCTSTKTSDRKHVYEASVLKQTAREGQISLELSAECVSKLQLRKETSCEMTVQFQLNRLSFCHMHWAIDNLPDLHNVLPDFSNCCVPINLTKQTELNNKQQIALNYILGKCQINKMVAPLLIYGPFGTGKTLCLASAAKALALRPQNKVLICTYTNSSADMYVREHFHPHITNGHPTLKLLRIKANRRGNSISRTDDITKKYCLCSPDKQSFVLPVQSDLESHRIIIITTSMARHLCEMKLPKGFFTHILIDEASQMLEGEALMALGLADKGTRVVLAGDHMQMAPKLFSVTKDKQSEHTLLNRLFHYYQDQTTDVAKKSRVIFNENYRSATAIVDFVSTNFYVSDGIKAMGDVPHHPRLHTLVFHHVRGECVLSFQSTTWLNISEVKTVVNTVQGILTDWPLEWGEKDPKQICVLSEGRQVEVIRSHLRYSSVTVQNLANIQGRQFRVVIITTVHTRESLLQAKSSCPEFFNDIRSVNTALTRAQSLVVVVGDAGALCCFGKCSKVWRAYIEHCIRKNSVNPDTFTTDVLEQELLEISKFQKTEKVEKLHSDVLLQAETDAILKEMQDYESDAEESEDEKEQKKTIYSCPDKDKLLELVRCNPALYRRGELVMEAYQSGYVVPQDHPHEPIQIEGRKNFGMSFPGDEVVVETIRRENGCLTGRVLGVTNRPSTFSEVVCSLENENYHKKYREIKGNLVPKTMVPLSHKITKIRILLKSRNIIPVWKNVDGRWTIIKTIHVDEQTNQNSVFVIQILGWKEHCSFPLGRVTEILPIGTSFEEGFEILKSEFRLTSPPPIYSFTIFQTANEKRRDFRALQTFTVDPPEAQNLDDAISVEDLGHCYEIGVHIADVASFVSKDSNLDKIAKERGATFYGAGQCIHMFPDPATWSLLPGEDRKAISFTVKVEKQTGTIQEKHFDLSLINSKRKLTYTEAESIINQDDGVQNFDPLEKCVRMAYRFARAQRKSRLKEGWGYAPPDKKQKPGEREAHLMIEELNIMFNHEVSQFLTENPDTRLCTPLKCQPTPKAENLDRIRNLYTELIPLSSHLTSHLDRCRMDLSNIITFSVYSPGSNSADLKPLSKDLRDAISFIDSKDHLEIGVHKADFSNLSNYNSETIVAQSDMWGFIPDKKRCAVTLLLKVAKKKGEVLQQNMFFSSIKSSRALSYSEIDGIINLSGKNQRRGYSLESCILEACNFALDHRKQRLAENEPSEESKCRIMMEELTLMFRNAVDRLIDPESQHHTISCPVAASPELVSQLKKNREEFGSLQEMEKHLDSVNEQDENNFLIFTSVWEKIEQAALKCDFYKMADLISTDDIHPQLFPAIIQLQKSNEKAFFIRSFSCSAALMGHYSLHLKSYTNASSPIRRYIDVVLQRLMHAVLSKHPVEYSPTDIDMLCEKSKREENRAQDFERKVESLLLAVNLQKQSTYKTTFVNTIKCYSECFKVSFPFDKSTFPEKLPVKYRNLQLEDQPEFNKKPKQVKLTWKKRVYSLSRTQSPLLNMEVSSEIRQSTWQAIIEAVRDEKWKEAKTLILKADVKDNSKSSETHNGSPMDAEKTFKSLNDHYTNFKLCLKVGDTVQVQLTSERDRGYWAPTVQLLRLTPCFEICLEHTDNPIKCFSALANQPSKGQYHNEDEYVQIWKPICEVESAATAVDDSDFVVIENVEIAWYKASDPPRLSGTFSLPVELVKKWAIEFDLAKCLLCIRKSGLKRKERELGELDPKCFTWVAHGVTTQCLDSSENSVNKLKIINFTIKYTQMSIPQFKRADRFTVEESAVNNLPWANQLVKDIVLRHRIVKEKGTRPVQIYELKREDPPAGLPKLNESQFKALERALNDRFTLIQGPPGTGKTVVGAYIVYWFSRLNPLNPWRQQESTEKSKKEVILYCGPSNKSVDVVAEFLLKFGGKLKVLRIYSRQMEMHEYPYPGSMLQLSHKSLRQEVSKPELRRITLHHRIRMSENPNSQRITEFDQRIKKSPDSLTDADIEEYKKLLNTARLHELQRHDIILCTCTAAASPNLTKNLSARQILIDECAMATEPQTLVPLVSFKPEKVVLLGDHKQLRPIVKNEHVRRLGLTRSLFETYTSKAILLDTQYRMQEEICRFPSDTFYNSLLKTDVDDRISFLQADINGIRKSAHIIFGDIRGTETNLLVKLGGVKNEDIAILSPYNAQVAQIRDRLDCTLKGITVTTITKSQGSEWRYVILSMVRSCPSEEIEPLLTREWLSKHIGFVGDENQLNVGITRAQDGLCILGNQELLNCNTVWKKLLEHYSGQGFVVPADQIKVRKNQIQ
ncbi:hypothetical protein DNTS_024319 [Danionella cerebrum]|uniref:Uncharacterized protein n=1 Tax=Danionella cerebrum TaxID=2873325 RepID=A0A553NLL0_9TELE|nr:hypothetical protein DNTS_024319 [Danionella translucida]